MDLAFDFVDAAFSSSPGSDPSIKDLAPGVPGLMVRALLCYLC